MIEEKPSLQIETERALNINVARSTAFVIPEAHGNSAEWLGSATVLQTSAGHVFLLTARHIAETIRTKSLWLGHYECKDVLRTSIEEANLHDDADVDAALLPLSPGSQDSLREYARNASDIPSTSVPNPGRWA